MLDRRPRAFSRFASAGRAQLDHSSEAEIIGAEIMIASLSKDRLESPGKLVL